MLTLTRFTLIVQFDIFGKKNTTALFTTEKCWQVLFKALLRRRTGIHTTSSADSLQLLRFKHFGMLRGKRFETGSADDECEETANTDSDFTSLNFQWKPVGYSRCCQVSPWHCLSTLDGENCASFCPLSSVSCKCVVTSTVNTVNQQLLPSNNLPTHSVNIFLAYIQSHEGTALCTKQFSTREFC